MNNAVAPNPVEKEAENPEIVDDTTLPNNTVEDDDSGEHAAAPEEDQTQTAGERTRQYTYAELEGTLIPNSTRSREARLLAENMGKTVLPLASDGTNVDFKQVGSNLVAYFIGHSRCLQFIEGKDDREKAENLSVEIIDLEQTLIAQFIDQIKAAHPEGQNDNLMSTKIEKGITSVRECFYRLVMGGSLDNKKIHDLIGEVKFLSEPKGETGEELIGKGEIVGYYKQENGRFVMYFYDSFINIPTADGRLRAANHEVAHIIAEGSDLFTDTNYTAFLQLAKSPNPQIPQEFRDKSPELASIIDMLNDPTSQQYLWTAYLRKLFVKLNATEEGDQKAKMRQTIAREMIAETVSSYLEADQSEEAFLIRRLKHAKGGIKNGLIGYLRAASGSETAEDFAKLCQQKGILFNPDGNYSPQELIALLSQFGELKNLFYANGLWGKKMNERFAGRGANINSLSELMAEGLYDYCDDYGSYVPNQESASSDTSTNDDPASVVGGILDFLTLGPKGKQKAQPKPAALKQAA